MCTRSRGSIVDIVTGYGLDDRGVELRVPVWSIIFSSPNRPDRLWGPDLYIHSPIRLHGVVVNSLSTGATLPFTCTWMCTYWIKHGHAVISAVLRFIVLSVWFYFLFYIIFLIIYKFEVLLKGWSGHLEYRVRSSLAYQPPPLLFPSLSSLPSFFFRVMSLS
jgi:hypothetical protein